MEETIISRTKLTQLLEYSSSLPTGTTIGKQWRKTRYSKNGAGDWMIGEYIEDPDPNMVGIKWTWAVSESGCVHQGSLNNTDQ